MNKRKVLVNVKRNEQTPQFLHACKTQKIKLMNISVKKNEVHFIVYYEDVKKLRRLRKKYAMHMSFDYVSGYVIQPQLKIVVALTLFIMMPLLAQQYIWKIEIEAPTPEQRWKAQQTMQAVRLPIKKSEVKELQKQAEQLVQKVPYIAWAHVATNGSVVNITLQPAPITDIKKQQHTGTLIATKNGIIDRYFITQGKNVVNKGDTVVAGDVLVEDSLNNEAQAKVFANYWLTVRFQLPVTISYYTVNNDEETSEKTVMTLTEEHIDEYILPLVERKLLAKLPLETTLTLQKLLHVTYDSDKVMGEALYLVNENIAAPSSR